MLENLADVRWDDDESDENGVQSIDNY
jgi:hypothetical protein